MFARIPGTFAIGGGPSYCVSGRDMADQRFTSILLFGVPGSGKGTQGAMLGAIPGFVHVAMGDVFRALDRSSTLGRKFMEYSTRGELVPDELTLEIWRSHVDQLVAAKKFRPASEFLLLDGIPRSQAQAKSIAPFVEVALVLHLVCRDLDQLEERMRRRAIHQHRPDDADPKVIRRRFEVYAASTEPILADFPAQIVRPIEASGTPARVLFSLLAEVAPLQERRFPNPLA